MEEERQCVSLLCSVAEQYPPQNDGLSACDILWQVSPQVSSIWHRGELMKKGSGQTSRRCRQHGWELEDGRKKPPSQTHEEKSTSSL